jgi:hypothetical protein
VEFAPKKRIILDWRAGSQQQTTDERRIALADKFSSASAKGVDIRLEDDQSGHRMSLWASNGTRSLDNTNFHVNSRGLGVAGGGVGQVDSGEAILIRFDCDVIIESAAIVAGNGTCGGFYRVGSHAPLAIYCIDGDIDAQDQSGILSDIGVLKAGEVLRLDSSPHFGVEAAGQWRLAAMTVRLLGEE